MAKSLNRVTILGNLGKDPEFQTTPSGASVCKFSVATTESYKDKSDNWQEVTDWHNVVFWNRLAEIANEYLQKGNKVYVEGKLKTRSYEKDGETKYITEIIGNNLVLLPNGDKKQNSQSGTTTDTGYQEPYRPNNDAGYVPF